jgi:hypothetical protein
MMINHNNGIILAISPVNKRLKTQMEVSWKWDGSINWIVKSCISVW